MRPTVERSRNESVTGSRGAPPSTVPATGGTAAGAMVRDLLARSAPAERDPHADEGERRWQERANCLGVDPDLFFPERGASTREAKAVCGSCEVRAECLEYALDHAEKFGIWGGLSERERRRLRRQRALARRNAASA